MFADFLFYFFHVHNNIVRNYPQLFFCVKKYKNTTYKYKNKMQYISKCSKANYTPMLYNTFFFINIL